MIEIAMNPPQGKDDATSSGCQCEVLIPGLDRSSIETAETRHVTAEVLHDLANWSQRKIPKVASTTGVASAPLLSSTAKVEESGATISLSLLFRPANETEDQSRLHGLGGGGWGAVPAVAVWLLKGPLIPILSDDQSDTQFLDQQSQLSSNEVKEDDMTSQFDPETAENNEEIEK